jgi:hypothetical protein
LSLTMKRREGLLGLWDTISLFSLHVNLQT